MVQKQDRGGGLQGDACCCGCCSFFLHFKEICFFEKPGSLEVRPAALCFIPRSWGTLPEVYTSPAHLRLAGQTPSWVRTIPETDQRQRILSPQCVHTYSSLPKISGVRMQERGALVRTDTLEECSRKWKQMVDTP
ncbi:uncharacterized protein LOC106728892 isoform X5 [Camelus ferus]|uniref:Uncharacterized protein LOC106728892 isoform X5 n=1 Tax=Camelus ferus TaxID=419612 RepID=A0A8B8S3K0_CAMFR|nr:uncharacterized protein LOC106728892 isoform X5 [Camelus ferus]